MKTTFRGLALWVFLGGFLGVLVPSLCHPSRWSKAPAVESAPVLTVPKVDAAAPPDASPPLPSETIPPGWTWTDDGFVQVADGWTTLTDKMLYELYCQRAEIKRLKARLAACRKGAAP